MLEEQIIDASVEELDELFSNFIAYLKIYLELDNCTYSIYSKHKNWLSEDTVMNPFFGALALYGNSNSKRKKRIDNALKNIKQAFDNSDDKDIWGLDTFYNILKNADRGKFNIGNVTRKLLFNGFREFFREEGEVPFAEIWKREGNDIFGKLTT